MQADRKEDEAPKTEVDLHGPPTPRVRIVGLGPLPFPKMPESKRTPKAESKPEADSIPTWEDELTVRRDPFDPFSVDWDEGEQATTARDPLPDSQPEHSTVRELPPLLTDTVNDGTQVMLPEPARLPPPKTLVSEPPPLPRFSTMPPLAVSSRPPRGEGAIPRWWWPLAAGLLIASCVAAFVLATMPREAALRIELAGAAVPARADIFVDGRKRCDTDPCLVEGLSPGRHVVKVLSGERSIVQEVDLVAREQGVMTLAFTSPPVPLSLPGERVTAPSATGVPSATAVPSVTPLPPGRGVGGEVLKIRRPLRRRAAAPRPSAEEDPYSDVTARSAPVAPPSATFTVPLEP